MKKKGAHSTGLAALSNRNETPIQTLNFCHVELDTHIYCVNVLSNQRRHPEKQKRTNLALSFYKAAGLTQA